jgi:hypothetical protein
MPKNCRMERIPPPTLISEPITVPGRLAHFGTNVAITETTCRPSSARIRAQYLQGLYHIAILEFACGMWVGINGNSVITAPLPTISRANPVWSLG